MEGERGRGKGKRERKWWTKLEERRKRMKREGERWKGGGERKVRATEGESKKERNIELFLEEGL